MRLEGVKVGCNFYREKNMKRSHNWLWSLPTLAVLATPISFDAVTHALKAHDNYRSIASSEIDPPAYPHLTRFQATLVKNTTIVVINDPVVLQKLNDEIKLEKERALKLESDLGVSQSQLASSIEANNISSAQIVELEKSVTEHVTRITELEDQVRQLEEAAEVSAEELAMTKASLEEAKLAADNAVKALEEANVKLAESKAEVEARDAIIAQKDLELEEKKLAIQEREERLAIKREELQLKKKEHDIFVCESELRFSALNKQIEELNVQQAQFTEVMLGLNQVLLGFLGQQQQQNSVWPMHGQGFNYFAQGYAPNPYALGQMQSPTQNAIMSSYQFNPWLQQPGQVVNNYYGQYPMQPQQNTHMGGYELQVPYYQQQNQIPGSYNFGMPSMIDDPRMQTQFGGFQDMQMGQAQQPFAPEIGQNQPGTMIDLGLIDPMMM
jgi:hypothetical protein